MNALTTFGRVSFAISTLFFGGQYLLLGHYAGGLPPVPPWAPGGAIGAYVVGAFLVLIGIALAAGWRVKLCGVLLGFVFLLCVVFLYSQKLSAIIHNGNDRTRAFETLALGAAAFVLAGSSTAANTVQRFNARKTDALVLFGRILFALCLIVFGAQHFMYGPFIASLIPRWIPGHLFFTDFTGGAFIAAGISIIVTVLADLGCALIGVMFLSWVLCLHGPRVAASPRNGDEWASAFVALAMGGASWITAGTFAKKNYANTA